MRPDLLDKLQEIEARYYITEDLIDKKLDKDKTFKPQKNSPVDYHLINLAKELNQTLESLQSYEELEQVTDYLTQKTPNFAKGFLRLLDEKKEEIKQAIEKLRDNSQDDE